MTNYSAVARSNYVHVSDMAGLVRALKPFESLCVIRDSIDSERYGIFCSFGGWAEIGCDKEV